MIVTRVELSDYMSGFTLNPVYGQDDAADMVIAGVQTDLERYLNRSLEPQTVTERVPVDRESGVVKTTRTPILSIPTGAPYYFYGDRIFVAGNYTTMDVSLYVLGHHISEQEWMTVTYTAGYDARSVLAGGPGDPSFADVRLAVLRVASREMTNRHDDTLSVKGLDTRNEGEPTGPQNGVQGWTYDELRMHDRLRKRTIA